MKRHTFLSLIAVAGVCITALLGASSASAGGFVADQYPANVHTVQASTTVFFVGGGAQQSHCEGQEFESVSISGPTKIAAPAASDATCTSGSMKMNGCKFIFHPGASNVGTVEIGPSGCGSIDITRENCKRSLGTQSMPASYEGAGEGALATITVEVEAHELSYTSSLCNPAAGKDGSLEASWELSATELFGEPTGLHLAASGIYLSGEGSAEPSKQPQIKTEWTAGMSGPTPISGDQAVGNPHVLNFAKGVRKIACTSARLAGEIPSGVSEASLSAEYAGCVANPSLPSTIVMNSCHQTLHVLNVGPPYAGSADVACSKGGDGIEATVYENATKQKESKPMCVYKVTPQSGLEGIGLETVGTGVERGIAVSLGLKNMAYTSLYSQSVLLCGLKTGASATNLTYTGGSTLFGL